MTYGHAFHLLPRCVNHPAKQAILTTSQGLLCGPCGMTDETPLTVSEEPLIRYAARTPPPAGGWGREP